MVSVRIGRGIWRCPPQLQSQNAWIFPSRSITPEANGNASLGLLKEARWRRRSLQGLLLFQIHNKFLQNHRKCSKTAKRTHKTHDRSKNTAVVEIGEIYGPKYAIGFLKTLQYQQERLWNCNKWSKYTIEPRNGLDHWLRHGSQRMTESMKRESWNHESVKRKGGSKWVETMIESDVYCVFGSHCR